MLIYIYFEATSNVDVESEESIMEIIRDIAKEKTVILISHRLYNCIPSDKIYFLKDGVIAEEGTHNELMSINGEYARIFNEQTNLESITKGESSNKFREHNKRREFKHSDIIIYFKNFILFNFFPPQKVAKSANNNSYKIIDYILDI